MPTWSRLECDTTFRRSLPSLDCVLLGRPRPNMFMNTVSQLRPTGEDLCPIFWSVDPHAILRVPYQKTHAPDDDIQQKIARFFSNVLGRPINQFTPLLPKIMPRWGKVRIVDGDKIKAATTSVRGENSDRNTSYVRVSISDTLTSVLTFL